MYKLIVVDDEADVREGVLREIDWEAAGFQVTDVAENGREALEMADKNPPDVVLTDIRMPFMDGLQLAEELRRLYPATKIILLTGFDEFEYARKAIHLQVEEFVLKPFSAGELLQALHKVKERLDAEMAERENLDTLQEHYRRSLPLLRELFLGTLVSRKLSEREIREKTSHYDLPMLGQNRLFCVTVLQLDGRTAESAVLALHTADDELRRFAVRNVAEEIVNRQQAGLVFQHNDHVIVLTISRSLDEPDEFVQSFQHSTSSLMEEICQSVEKYLKLTVTAGTGTVAAHPGDLKYSCDDALSALDYRLLYGGNRVISIGDVESRGAAPLRLDDLQEQAFARCLKVGLVQEMESLVHEMFAPLLDAGSASTFRDAQIFLLQIVTTMLKTAHETDNGSNGYGGTAANPLKDLNQFGSLEDAKDWVVRTCAELMGRISADRQTAHRSLIEEAKKFTRENYADSDISIARVCSHLHISPGYFSSLFKRETKMTYLAYLLNYRMETAKELLRTTDLKTFEIAEKVGYADPNYFSFSFKKQAGQSPKDYRSGARGDAG